MVNFIEIMLYRSEKQSHLNLFQTNKLKLYTLQNNPQPVKIEISQILGLESFSFLFAIFFLFLYTILKSLLSSSFVLIMYPMRTFIIHFLIWIFVFFFFFLNPAWEFKGNIFGNDMVEFIWRSMVKIQGVINFANVFF